MPTEHEVIPGTDVYGPGTYIDKHFIPVPEDARRVFELLAKATPGFTEDPRVLDSVSFEGSLEPIISGPIKAPVVAAALHAMCGVVANEILEQAHGEKEHERRVTINTDHAALWLGSVFAVKINGSSASDILLAGGLPALFKRDFEHGAFGNPLRLRTTALYPTKKPDVWYQLHGSLNADPVLASIGVAPDTKCTREEAYDLIREHVQKFTAEELDMMNVKNGFCGSTCYTPAAWRETLMGKRLEKHPLVNYTRESYAIPTPPTPRPAGLTDKRPLAGIKVVELVRIIAGPVIGSTLAAFGADVIRVNCSRLPDINALQLALNAGIRTIDLDLTNDEDLARLHELVQDADVFIGGFRPGALARKGLSLHNMLEMAGKRGKGIVYVEENCYGPDGPFYDRPGWQQIGDAASGSSYVTGRALGHTDGTCVLPPLPISDMVTGLIGALGALMAIRDRATLGGSYHVLSSLVAADTISLTPEVGLYSPEVVKKNADTFQWDPMGPAQFVIELLLVMMKGWQAVYPEYFAENSPFMAKFEDSHWGAMEVVKPVVRLGDEAATPHWVSPPVPHCYHDRNISWL
ncbi:alpha methylacyl-CoA racemase [Penicillium canariense]|uniref:Alpha methylacyl-CoA racemase n=1 Tax=Penicillium canariense TaxID=189055 RepID=A0A9W9LPC2_9EURO|nr:alpha methylacyl-CoA racemase [Penicillium canariense]KAJ5168041.1 alpha methylacyl-CoA racemase [Penicillium canariense]